MRLPIYSNFLEREIGFQNMAQYGTNLVTKLLEVVNDFNKAANSQEKNWHIMLKSTSMIYGIETIPVTWSSHVELISHFVEKVP